MLKNEYVLICDHHDARGIDDGDIIAGADDNGTASVRDVPENVNYQKFFRTTQLVYLAAFEFGNVKNMLKLDVNPQVTSRGSRNMREPSLYK